MKMYETSGRLVDNWYAAGLSKQYAKGKPVSVTIFELPLVVWRASTGEIQASEDRCLHRNAPLSKGKVIDDCLICPYHGWGYDTDGVCVDIPSEGPNFKASKRRGLRSYSTLERDGLVWIWMGSGEPTKDPFSMPLLEDKGWHHYYMTTPFENNVTNLVENFMDVPHTIFVHKGWFRSRKKIKIEASVERQEDAVLVSYEQSHDSIGFSSWLVNPKKLPMKHTDNFYMPNNTRVDYIFGAEERGFIICSTCTPVTPTSSMVYTLISYKFGWLTPLAKLALAAYTRKVIDQDVWIMKEQSTVLQQYGAAHYHSSQCDTMHVYIESLRKAAQLDEPVLSNKKKQIEFWV
jgi:phenylpropionate dioxygenase-like ring-hydroxylating dioxygenase large terminal subunit